MAETITVKVTTIPTLTGDTVASYTVHSDEDGQLDTMSTTEAAAGHDVELSVGATHSITVKAVWTTAGATTTVGSNAVSVTTASTILFEDDFAGTSIDTAKWDVTNPNSANVPVTQNDELIVTYDGTTATTNYADNLTGNTGYDIATTKVLSFDVQHTNQHQQRWGVGFTKDAADLTVNEDNIKISFSGTSGAITLTMKEGNSVTYQTSPYESISTLTTFKIVISGGDVSFWIWGTSWTQLGVTTSHISTGSWYPFIDFANKIDTAGVFNVDNLFVSNEDFTTQIPV